MAVKEMNVAPTKEGGDVGLKAFEAKDELAAPGNGESILIPDDVKTISVTVEPTGATAKVQTTTNSVAEVKAGTETWVDWDLGAVAVDTNDTADPVTAMRLVQIGAGSSIMTMRAQ
jgi:hypothetical protein